MPTVAGTDFLRPSAEKQAALRSREEDRARVKKQQAKEQAAERKRKRTEQAERAATIEEELRTSRDKREQREKREAAAAAAARKAPAPAPAPVKKSAVDKERDDAINAYLDQKVFYGRAAYSDKEMIQQLCGESYQRSYDKDRKLWGTRVPTFLRRLINSHRWEPFGIPPEWHEALLAAADQRVADELLRAEAKAQAKREQAIEEQRLRERRAIADAARAAKAQAKAQVKAAAEAEAEAPPSPPAKPKTEQELKEEEEARRRRMEYEPPNREETDHVTDLGFDPGVAEASRTWAELGPVTGLSHESRLLRWIGIVVNGVQSEYEFTPERWDKAFMADAENSAVRAAVANMNDRAAGRAYEPLAAW